MKTFLELKVWKKAHQLTLDIYQETRSFPREEMYGLTSQLRRAVLSTATNIVEGNKRRSPKDFSHFLNIAQGSNEEAKYLLIVASELKYLPASSATRLSDLASEIGAMLHAFRNQLSADS
jgi:four helix bundle protein